jgi:hypothetical protein
VIGSLCGCRKLAVVVERKRVVWMKVAYFCRKGKHESFTVYFFFCMMTLKSPFFLLLHAPVQRKVCVSCSDFFFVCVVQHA